MFELVLKSHEETAKCLNPGVYIGLIDYTIELDTAMKKHLETARLFKGMLKIVQDELLDCMLNICRKEIELQIRASKFVSIQSDETTDILNHCQMVLVFHYVFEGSVYERFWAFLNPEGKVLIL